MIVNLVFYAFSTYVYYTHNNVKALETWHGVPMYKYVKQMCEKFTTIKVKMGGALHTLLALAKTRLNFWYDSEETSYCNSVNITLKIETNSGNEEEEFEMYVAYDVDDIVAVRCR